MSVHLRAKFAAASFVAALALAACGANTEPVSTSDSPAVPATEATPVPTADAPAATAEAPAASAAPVPIKKIKIKLRKWSSGFSNPLLVTSRPGDDRIYVVERGGKVKSVQADGTGATVVLNISSKVGSGGERGLLGLAFDPADPSRMFIDYTNVSGNTVVAEYSFPLADEAADPTAVQVVLTQNQPYSNHNGGMIAFGPDGYLYVGFGDGGSGGDPGNRAQNPKNLLGSIVRIDVSGASGYEIPSDNPFADGVDGAPEVWAYGLRNPWRFSFDGNNLYIGDVGQYKVEEIDVVDSTTAAGDNFGWRVMEGNTCYSTGKKCSSIKRGFVPPVHVFRQKYGRCAVTGGYVSHDAANPKLEGVYIYGDYCSGKIYGMRVEDGVRVDKHLLKDSSAYISAFGTDNNGRVFVVDIARGRILLVVQR